MFCFALLKSLYENGFVSDKDKIFLEKKYQYIRIINKDEKRLINVYFEKEPIIDFFQNTEYDKELKYYGINEKDLIIINERLVKEELKL
ncbi:spore coat protein CotS [Campylobacter sp. TTU-622]|uniref:spore coat protein CotS n=1 Tax=Campylobacter sp. TTU-622 TaxID=2800583 RepID=UPI001F352FF9|nr:spore coat protein CotS [Campylobacter sp. TTU-622]